MDIVNDDLQLQFGNTTHVINNYDYIYLYI